MDGGWDLVRVAYQNRTKGAGGVSQWSSKPLERVIEVAQALGVESVLIEYRYIDADWRSEHTNFYGTTFVRFPSVCHRLHFFATKVGRKLRDLDNPAVVESYRGYSVMRPLPEAPVGRTMMTPPPELNGATVTVTSEKVHLFGSEFEVRGMPFISQDALYLRCAHASIWMVLRHAHLRHGLPRRLPGDIRDAGVGGVVVGRQMPSDGLSVAQMLGALDILGLPTGSLKPDADEGPGTVQVPGSLTLYGIVCRYVNSELPPIVVSQEHAWVIVGWKREQSDGHPHLTVWRHDDARGPYMRVEDPWNETEPAHQDWRLILPPLLPKMNMDAERAEAAGAPALTQLITLLDPALSGQPSRAFEALQTGRLTWRTYAVASVDFKARLKHRGLPRTLVKMLRLVQLPRYVWVVEAVDRDARDAHLADVLGSAIFDSTHAGARRALIQPLAAHAEDVAFTFRPDALLTDLRDLESRAPVLGDHMVRAAFATGAAAPDPEE